MALYEHVLIARQDISAQQAEQLNEDLKALIETAAPLAGHSSVTDYLVQALRESASRTDSGVKGIRRRRAPTASKMALAMAAPRLSVSASGVPSASERPISSTSW